MDERIESAVKQNRAIAQLHLQWKMDAWKLEMGMLEFPPEDDREQDGWSLRRRPQPVGRPYRFLPTFNGYGYLVRDKENI